MKAAFNAVVAIITGVLSGWGVGGGSLLLVYMTAVGGYTRLSAASINLLYFFPTAGGSLLGHIKNKQIVWRVVLSVAAAGAVTAILASLLSNALDGVWMRRAFGAFFIYVGVTELFKKSK